MNCDEVGCTDYYITVLGNGTQTANLVEWWIKAENGVAGSWLNFTDNSVKFGWTHWIAIRYSVAKTALTEVARLRVHDCNQDIVDILPLNIPRAAAWRKWRFECHFGIGCDYTLVNHSWGPGSMPALPPP